SSTSRPSFSTRSAAPGTSSRGPRRLSRSARRRSPAADGEPGQRLMADWETVSSLATGAGTLVLAVATFAAVRSSNRSARIAELALQEQRRPLLVQSRLGVDPEQKIMFVDEHWVRVGGGYAVAENVDGVIYLAMSLRNVGAGIGVCQGWGVRSGLLRNNVDHFREDELRTQ